jgi:hypothetical protein
MFPYKSIKHVAMVLATGPDLKKRDDFIVIAPIITHTFRMLRRYEGKKYITATEKNLRLVDDLLSIPIYGYDYTTDTVFFERAPLEDD